LALCAEAELVPSGTDKALDAGEFSPETALFGGYFTETGPSGLENESWIRGNANREGFRFIGIEIRKGRSEDFHFYPKTSVLCVAKRFRV
jgi:hypothetical protein